MLELLKSVKDCVYSQINGTGNIIKEMSASFTGKN